MATNLQHLERMFYGGKRLAVTIGLDQAPAATARRTRAHAWDAEPTKGGNQLTPQFCRATDQYLQNAGLDPDDVKTVMEVLQRYQGEEDGDATIAVGAPRGPIDQTGPMGNQDSARRHAQDATYHEAPWAFDSRGSRLPAPVPMTSDFAKRNPGAARIRILG